MEPSSHSVCIRWFGLEVFMATGFVRVGELHNAIITYLRIAYPEGVPAAVQARVASLTQLPADAEVPESMLEVSQCMGRPVYALRLGQPRYPHMKLMVEASPGGTGYLFRADAHDMHLHAPEGSADAGPLAALRAQNKVLTEAIEAAWTAAGLPTFRSYLRGELEKRRARGAGPV